MAENWPIKINLLGSDPELVEAFEILTGQRGAEFGKGTPAYLRSQAVLRAAIDRFESHPHLREVIVMNPPFDSTKPAARVEPDNPSQPRHSRTV